MSIKGLLSWLAILEYRHHTLVVLLSIIFTAFMLNGASRVYMESDFTKEFPQDIPTIVNEKKIASKFGGGDLILVVVELDQGVDIKNRPYDIRDPRIMRMLLDLQNQLEAEAKIDRVLSAGALFQYGIPQTLSGVRTALSNIPGSDGFFNKDYSITLLYAYTNVGQAEKAVVDMTALIEDNIESVAKPPAVKMSITGGPPIRDTMLKILWSDAIYTIVLAAAVILLLLIALQKSVYKGVLVFIPLSFGLIWTLGAMGYLDIPLSIATVAIGAMILGLGVEYGIFVVERYMEELEEGGLCPEDALMNSLPAVGGAIVGSAVTTMVGFYSLTLSIMPLLQRLGQTLALGILSCLLVALLVNPAFIILAGRLTHYSERCRR